MKKPREKTIEDNADEDGIRELAIDAMERTERRRRAASRRSEPRECPLCFGEGSYPLDDELEHRCFLCEGAGHYWEQ
jgi:hypothetical protein